MDRPSARLMPRAEAAFRAGDYASAERVLRRVLRTEPMNSKANELLAYIAGNRGDLEEVRARLEAATSTPEASREAWYYLGKYFMQAGESSSAEAALTRALSIDRAFFEALHDRGLLRTELGKAEAAVDDFDRALALKPDSFEAFYNRGRALDRLQRYQEAVESYDHALALKPAHAQSWTNRGAALVDLTRHEEALESFDRAIALAPTHVEAWSGRGIALNFLRRHTEALAAYARGLQIRPGDSEVRWREFFTRAALGDYEAAWPLFEARWNRPEIGRLRHPGIASWRGEETLEGKRILAWSEQGFGDTLHFCRYANLLARDAAEVVLEVPRALVPLLASSFPDCKVIELDAPVEPPCDLQVPMMSLPFACGTRLGSIPGHVPYLRVDPGTVDRWRERLGVTERLRVGIACSGNPGPRMSHRVRRIPLEEFSRLSAFADVFLIQKEIGAADAGWLQANGDAVRSFADELVGFDDTAALVECMDLIVSADTSLVHLAGGLGKPTWAMLPWESEWRWLLDREDSPWYPTARLFRKGRHESWDAVLSRVARELAHWRP